LEECAIRVVRKALKTRCKTFSVRMARGTAYGWIDIWGSDEFNHFTDEEKKVLEEFGIPYGGNCALISPDDRDYWVKKLANLMPEAGALLIGEVLGKPFGGLSCLSSTLMLFL
jgi:hypothetical protein